MKRVFSVPSAFQSGPHLPPRAMASSSASTSVLLFSILFLLTLGASARPCKTLFISHAISSAGYGRASSEPATTFEVSEISATGEQVPSTFFAIYRVSPLRRHNYLPYFPSAAAASVEPHRHRLRVPFGIERSVLPRRVAHGELSFGESSLRERAVDVLIVVAGLLFGAGCGGLASVAMYLAWSVINNCYEEGGSSGHDFREDGDEDDGMESPKKGGYYTDLPDAPATPVAPLKEGYTGN